MDVAYSERRIEVRDIEGSPTFQTKNAATIAPSAFWIVTIEDDFPRFKKYLPFNEFTITNNSTEDIEFFRNQDINQRNAILILAGQARTVSGKSLFSFKIKNIDAANTVSANEIEILAERVGGTTNELSKRIMKNPLIKMLVGG